jgi:membrane carboxypeptidase/penicillin-binding protein
MSALPFLRRRRKRHTNERQRKQNRLTNSLITTGAGLILLLCTIGIGGFLAYAVLTLELPAVDQLPVLMSGSLLQPTRIYDRTGTHLITILAPQDGPRTYIPIDPHSSNHIPDSLVRATVTLMDPGFWIHAGFQLSGLTNPNEHPTLAQKLAFDLLLWNEPAGLRRAIRERILAAQLTSHFGREKILEWYLNSANYAHFAYGAEAAAQLYLGKPVSQLNLAETTILASINQTPGINPLDAPQAIMLRQAETINLMQKRGTASEIEARLARKTNIDFKSEPSITNIAPAFSALTLSQLEDLYDRTRIEHGGLQVITTLDYDLQLRTNCALQTQFARLDSTGALPSPQPCQGAETLPLLPSTEKAPHNASAVVLDPRNGQILALVGDSSQGLNSNFITPHRPGTLLTPFIFLTGFTRGLSPASLVWDLPDPTPLSGTDGITPTPTTQVQPQVEISAQAQNSGQTTGGPIRLRFALINDNLVTATQVFTEMGASLVQQTMVSFGLDIPATNVKTLLETDQRYSVIQMAQVYGILGTQGTLNGEKSQNGMTTSTILSIRNLDGQTLTTGKGTITEQIVNPQLAYLLTDVLSANITELDRPAAFKTGILPDAVGTETWAIGYTPYRSVAVWMDGEALTTRPATGLWTAIMQSANRAVPADNWDLPTGMLKLRVCDPSGLLPTAACPNIVEEIFIEGFQPTQTDTLFRSYEINRETGLLATVFTPEQLVEKQVFMQVPPEAQAWARSINLPIPPTQYDNIQPPKSNPDVILTFPIMFSDLGGFFAVTGSATGENFSYYRLQYGQGLNPETWTQIGSDTSTPVSEGKLGEWDTTGLQGLYSLQLIVIHEDRSLLTYTVQITLTNP